MEQHLFKVSFPLGTKLLISVVALILLVIGFLNVSTILLFKSDKKAYTFQARSTEAVLAGREFSHLLESTLESLRLAMATIDPRRPITITQRSNFENFAKAQTGFLKLSLNFVNQQDGMTIPILEKGSDPVIQDERPLPEVMRQALPSLLKRSYAFVNGSKVGSRPVIIVLFADTRLKDLPAGLPVAMGHVDLSTFGEELRTSDITIADQSGQILFDTDPAKQFGTQQADDDQAFKEAAQSQVTSGAKEYQHDERDYLASYYKPGYGIIAIARTDMGIAMRSAHELTLKFILLCGMAVGLAFVFAIVFAKTLTAPLNRLYDATKQISAGNFNLHLREASRDEIGALSSSFNTMSRKIQELILESKEKGRMENELAIASTVQQTLIPPPSFSNSNIQIESHYAPASECGGDWWGFFGVGKKMALLIGDATGHGIPSALITASARSCFSVMHKLAQEEPEFSFTPAAMLSYANRVVFDSASGKIMMTFFIGVIDFDSMTLTYGSAGHNPPWLYRKEGDKIVQQSLMAKGLRLGERRDAPAFEQREISINPGDLLFLYTDGLTEGKNIFGEQYGKKRTRATIENAIDGGPNKIVRDLIHEYQHHNRSKELDDDVTFAVASILPTA